MERKSFLATGLLCYFLGCLGIHRFYTGYKGIGIAQLLTLGGCGIWALIDLIMICINNYKDANGMELEGYTPKFGWIVLTITIVFTLLRVVPLIIRG